MKTAACQGSARKSSFFLACEGKDLGSRMSDLHAVKPGLVSQKKEYFLRSTLTRLGATGKVKVISTSGAKLHFQLKQNTVGLETSYDDQFSGKPGFRLR